VRVTLVEVTDFRCYESARLELPEGVTVVLGANGEGKTSLLEAIAWSALGRSFRGVPDAALVREGVERAVLRVASEEGGGRERLIEAEIHRAGRNRVLLDRHPLRRTRDLFDGLRVTVFAPDDLELVKGGPAHRREYLDALLVAAAPRYAAAHGDYERVLRQRNALLRSGVRDEVARTTLEVFDEQLVVAGAELVRGRLRLAARLAPGVDAAYRELAGAGEQIDARYSAEWAEGASPDPDAVVPALRAALERLRAREQGEQRTLALALRLGGHRVVAETVGDDPVLLLDDVFSELDDRRSAALVARLPGAQTVVTTAGVLPPGVHPAARLHVHAGKIEPAG
jgi:DNA replication and repair protein RecF